MNNTKVFSGEKLRLARLLNDLTQQDLGEAIFASRQYVHQLESEARTPATDVLNALYEVLKVKPPFFELAISNEVKLEQCHFRKRKTTPIKMANRVLAFSTIFEQLVTFILEHLELPHVNFPEMKQSSDKYTNSDIEKAAYECRVLWGLDNGPISHVTRALENAGVMITQYSGVSDKVDALSLNRKFPIIVRNDAKESVCRMRFDLAHECGHFVLHDGIETGDNITESEADKFASEFLFPRKQFIQEFQNFKGKRLNWNLIYSLKLKWGMSVRAIIYKAHNNDLITAQQFRGANIWLNKTGQSKTEKYDDKIQEETPELLSDTFDVLKNQLGMNFQYIADTLAIDPELLSLITGIVPDSENNVTNVIPIK